MYGSYWYGNKSETSDERYHRERAEELQRQIDDTFLLPDGYRERDYEAQRRELLQEKVRS